LRGHNSRRSNSSSDCRGAARQFIAILRSLRQLQNTKSRQASLTAIREKRGWVRDDTRHPSIRFCFGGAGALAVCGVRFNVMNVLKQSKLYCNGCREIAINLPGRKWRTKVRR
jgi:hypothetical protein